MAMEFMSLFGADCMLVCTCTVRINQFTYDAGTGINEVEEGQRFKVWLTLRHTEICISESIDIAIVIEYWDLGLGIGDGLTLACY